MTIRLEITVETAAELRRDLEALARMTNPLSASTQTDSSSGPEPAEARAEPVVASPEPKAGNTPKRRGRPPKNPQPETQPEVSAPSVTEPETSSEPENPASADDLPEISDRDMNAFCARAAAVLTAPVVIEAARPYFKEGERALPTRIASTADRWAFVRAIEEASGVKYHG